MLQQLQSIITSFHNWCLYQHQNQHPSKQANLQNSQTKMQSQVNTSVVSCRKSSHSIRQRFLEIWRTNCKTNVKHLSEDFIKFSAFLVFFRYAPYHPLIHTASPWIFVISFTQLKKHFTSDVSQHKTSYKFWSSIRYGKSNNEKALFWLIFYEILVIKMQTF